MMLHVWGDGEPPELYAAYTIVKELGLGWPTVLGREPSLDEIRLLVECVNIVQEHRRGKSDAGFDT